jgi:hypothetical protein
VLQSLDLTPEQALALAEGLEVAALPENREYRYHHYQDNCSTKVRDHLDRVLGGRLREAGKASARFTLRGHTRRHSGRQPVVDFALRFWMNASMEAPITVWEEMFLPGELARVVESIGLARATQRVFEPVDRPPIPEAPPTHGPYLFLVGLLLGGLAWFLGVRRDRARGWRVALGLTHSLTGLAFGFLGTLGTLMWAFTEWDVTFDNANQLLANPLTLAAFPLGVGLAFGRMGGAGGVPGRAERWLSRSWTLLAGTSILALLLAVLTITGQANGAVIALLLPMNLGFALSLRPTDTSVLPASAKSPEEAAPEPPSLA